MISLHKYSVLNIIWDILFLISYHVLSPSQSYESNLLETILCTSFIIMTFSTIIINKNAIQSIFNDLNTLKLLVSFYGIMLFNIFNMSMLFIFYVIYDVINFQNLYFWSYDYNLYNLIFGISTIINLIQLSGIVLYTIYYISFKNKHQTYGTSRLFTSSQIIDNDYASLLSVQNIPNINEVTDNNDNFACSKHFFNVLLSIYCIGNMTVNIYVIFQDYNVYEEFIGSLYHILSSAMLLRLLFDSKTDKIKYVLMSILTFVCLVTSYIIDTYMFAKIVYNDNYSLRLYDGKTLFLLNHHIVTMIIMVYLIRKLINKKNNVTGYDSTRLV